MLYTNEKGITVCNDTMPTNTIKHNYHVTCNLIDRKRNFHIIDLASMNSKKSLVCRFPWIEGSRSFIQRRKALLYVIILHQQIPLNIIVHVTCNFDT